MKKALFVIVSSLLFSSSVLAQDGPGKSMPLNLVDACIFRLTTCAPAAAPKPLPAPAIQPAPLPVRPLPDPPVVPLPSDPIRFWPTPAPSPKPHRCLPFERCIPFPMFQ
ncbi:hypothetical protein [Deinococcus sp.]|uniref:hypothetical protein n=1 Tax=Deinococcus sp. TaxID=47478 RepID=UPI0025DA2778|nr:hypothetical protein [Deinococcus sp.]